MLADEFGEHAVDAKGRSCGDDGCNNGYNEEDELEGEAHTATHAQTEETMKRRRSWEATK